MRAVLVLGGDPPTDAELDRLQDAPLLVATDGGAEALLRRGIRPHRIIGDMDSLSPEMEQLAIAEEVPIERHPRDKMETDGELALRHILSHGPIEVVLVGGHGGRSAMFLTHLDLLRRCAELGVGAVLRGFHEEVCVVLAGSEATFTAPGLLDLIAMEDAVVDLSGLRYSGEAIVLRPWSGQGVSNAIEDEVARVGVRAGAVIVVQEREPEPERGPA